MKLAVTQLFLAYQSYQEFILCYFKAPLCSEGLNNKYRVVFSFSEKIFSKFRTGGPSDNNHWSLYVTPSFAVGLSGIRFKSIISEKAGFTIY